MKSKWVGILTAVLMASSAVLEGTEIRVSEPQSVTLTIYDIGTALVRERRRANVVKGENELVIGALPSKLDPGSVSFSTPADPLGLQILEQRFLHDLSHVDRLFNRYLGRQVVIATAGSVEEGMLISAPRIDDSARGDVPLVLSRKEDQKILYLDLDWIKSVTFPDAESTSYLEPTLLCRIRSEKEGVENFRLNYAVDGLSWSAFYELILNPGGRDAALEGRVRVANETEGSFSDARVRLVSTERGVMTASRGRHRDASERSEPGSTTLRHVYGREVLAFEQQEAGITPLDIYELPEPLSIERRDERYIQMQSAPAVPVFRFYVYDGVRFDRFQRNRRNDWNYGTEFHTKVEAHVEFENSEAAGLGMNMAPGQLRLYERKSDGTLDLLGEDFLDAVAAGTTGHVKLGVARGLRGERERTGYSEVVPLHTYEETFEIRLENNSDSDAEIRVVEHLYRWHDYEIVRADAEYTETAPQTIEFRPKLKAGGRRSIHYTVRYNW